MLSNIRYRIACWLWPELTLTVNQNTNSRAISVLQSDNELLRSYTQDLTRSISERDTQIKQLNKSAYVVCQLASYLHVCRLDLHDIRKLIDNIENKIEVLERLRKDSDEQVTPDADTEPGRVDRPEEQ